MSPELDRLLSAMYERDTCEPQHRANWDATVSRLTAAAMAKLPGVTYEDFIAAIRPRYHEFKRARRHPSILPPKA